MIPRMVSVTGVKEWREGVVHSLDDYLVGEEPLEIRVGDVPISVTMRTPGNDLELAPGFLFTEGLITSRAQIVSVRHEPGVIQTDAIRNDAFPNDATQNDATQNDATQIGATQNGANRVRVDLAAGVAFDLQSSQRNFYAASSCGVCGKASIDAVRVRNIAPPNPHCRVDPEVLCRLPDQMRAVQQVFSRTGALHAAALFSFGGQLQILREDVGRHNAVDKVIGWALFNSRLPLSGSLLMVSGRGGFEIVQKALVAGIPVLASVSAPSDLAVKLAREFGMTLIGFLRGRRFVIYAGAQRLASAPALRAG